MKLESKRNVMSTNKNIFGFCHCEEVRRSNLKDCHTLLRFVRNNKFGLFIICFLFSLNAFSQNLKKGNKEFTEKNYAEAEADYRIEKSKAESKSTASYNLGNAIYRQNSYGESKFAYSETIEKSTDKSEKHKAYHNLGNVLMKEKNYQGAVEAYKNALRNNPYDEQTRYNYALAKDMLDKNPPPPDQNQDDKKDNQDQNQDNQNKENQKGNDNQDNQDNKDNQDNQDQNQDKGDNKDNQDQKGDGNKDQKPEGNQSGMPKQRIDNLLDAVENQEKGIQQRVQKKKELEERKGQPRQTEKNW